MTNNQASQSNWYFDEFTCDQEYVDRAVRALSVDATKDEILDLFNGEEQSELAFLAGASPALDNVDIEKQLSGLPKELVDAVRTIKDPEDREDCMSFAMEDLVRYWNRFDPAKSNNPFAYYTQIAKNGFAKGWKKLHPPKALKTIPFSYITGNDNSYNI